MNKGIERVFSKEVELAKLMYDTYCQAVGGKAYNGDPLPTSEELFSDKSKTVQANGWYEVAVMVDEFYGNLYSS